MGFGEHGKRALLLWNRRRKPTFEGNEGNIGITGYIRKQIFDFLKTGEHANLFQEDKGTGAPLGGPRHCFH